MRDSLQNVRLLKAVYLVLAIVLSGVSFIHFSYLFSIKQFAMPILEFLEATWPLFFLPLSAILFLMAISKQGEEVNEVADKISLAASTSGCIYYLLFGGSFLVWTAFLPLLRWESWVFGVFPTILLSVVLSNSLKNLRERQYKNK